MAVTTLNGPYCEWVKSSPRRAESRRLDTHDFVRIGYLRHHGARGRVPGVAVPGTHIRQRPMGIRIRRALVVCPSPGDPLRGAATESPVCGFPWSSNGY